MPFFAELTTELTTEQLRAVATSVEAEASKPETVLFAMPPQSAGGPQSAGTTRLSDSFRAFLETSMPRSTHRGQCGQSDGYRGQGAVFDNDGGNDGDFDDGIAVVGVIGPASASSSCCLPVEKDGSAGGAAERFSNFGVDFVVIDDSDDDGD